MAIEPVFALRAPTPVAPPVLLGNSQATADSQAADKDAQEFRKLLNRGDAAEAAPADAAPPSKDTDPADGGVGRKKLLNTGKSAAGSASTGYADTAAWMAAYPPPAPLPMAAPVSVPSGTATTEDMDALKAPRSMAALQADTAAVTGSAAAHGSVLPPGLPDARTQTLQLANYASVLGQMQSRWGAAGSGAPDTLVSAAQAGAPLVMGTAAADARADPMARGEMWVLPIHDVAALQAATETATALKWAVRETADRREGGGADPIPLGGGGQAHFTPTVQFENAALPWDTGQSAPAVADQVSYWIAQGIQNAELTFQGADAQPVQVSISVLGNEAQVEFRTDQPETRDLLASAAAHLKDLLQSQGMVLTGLSVGSSGSGGAHAREPRGLSEMRRNAPRAAPEVAAVRPAVPQPASGRMVDLFV